jgi:hypothetical protein
MPIVEHEFMELTKTLDVDAFWLENEKCKAFTRNKLRCSLSFSPDDHWLFEFTNIPSTLRYYNDKAYRDTLHQEVNQSTKQYVGQTFFDEDSWQFHPNRIEYLFGCKPSLLEGGTPWLTPVTNDPDEFARVLDQAEKTDLHIWTFPDEFLSEWEEHKRQARALRSLGDGSRGPATIMTSVLHPETVFLWMFDYPDLMKRFSDILATKMVELNRILREFSGNTQAGWWITDDNCALFNPPLYREYCYPVLDKVLNAMAPGDASRYQHSDSSMGHLLTLQYELGIRSVNYGPNVDAALIRERMPEALINGHMPPFLLRNGNPDEIKTRVLDDFHKAGQTGGLNMTTAGSLAAGTGVGRMRWYMQIVQNHCRYDS